MADQFAPWPVKTKASGDVDIKIGTEVAGVAIGAAADAEASGNGSVIALLKRLRTLLNGGLPAALGQGTMAQSLPVVLASNQTSVPVTGAFGGNPTSPKSSTGTASAVAASGSGTIDGTALTDGVSGRLASVIVGSSVEMRWDIQTVKNNVATTVAVVYTQAGSTFAWNTPHTNYITIVSVAAQTDNFRVVANNLDTALAADAKATFLWDES